MSYGCFDRLPYLDSYVLYGISRETGLPVQTKIEFRGSRGCVYALHDQYEDPGCVGCSWHEKALDNRRTYLVSPNGASHGEMAGIVRVAHSD